MLAPDALGPEHPRRGLLHDVLQVIADDVSLLEEEPHGVGEILHLRESLILEHGVCPQVREADADQAGDVVAVLVPVLQGDDLALDEVAHPRAHSLGDIGDDVLVLLLQREEHRGDLGVLVHENFVVLLAARVDVLRVVNLLPEYLQLRALGLIRDAHVVLDGVQRAEHEVEDAHRVLQLVRQLLDDDRERPGHEVEHVVAEPEVGFLRQLLRLVRHAFHPVQRNDVPGVLQDERERAHGELSRRASNKIRQRWNRGSIGADQSARATAATDVRRAEGGGRR